MEAKQIWVMAFVLTGSAWAQSIRINDTPRDGIPEEYLVEKGDTLWDVCDFYFRDPHRWPNVWALNPHVTNPHWIYPGDVLRLRMPLPPGTPGAKTPSFRVVAGTEQARQISLNEGFIGVGEDPTVGRIDGSKTPTRFLSQDDEVYLKFSTRDGIRVGQEFSIFESLGDVSHPESDDVLGQKIRMKGVVRLTQLSEDAATGIILTSLSEIERGAPLMPITTHRVTIQPTQNLIDLKGTVVDSLTKKSQQGQFDTLFIDKGSEDGVKVGNRFFLVRQGDGYEGSEGADGRPLEQVGEALVVRTQAKSCTALVTRSAVEIYRGEQAVMERHY